MDKTMYDFLTKWALSGRKDANGRRPVFYSELAALVGLDMEDPQARLEIGRRLGKISEYTVAHGCPMLSSIVVHKSGSWIPGHGFYECGQALGLVRAGE